MELFKVGGECPDRNYLFMGKCNLFRMVPKLRLAYEGMIFHRRFRRPRVLLCRNISAATTAQSSISGSNNAHPRQSRIAPNHTGVRILRRVPTEVRERKCMEVLL